MIEPRLWWIALGPAALAATGLVPAVVANARARRFGRLAFAMSVVALGAAVAATVALMVFGPMRTGTLGLPGSGFALYLDRLTAVLFVLVAFVGAAVIRYSIHYLDGDPEHGRFTKWLCLTLAAVLLLIISGHLFQFAIAWIATSVGLHRLLLFYPDRRAAVLAARKKFVASRLGDLCLAGAMVPAVQAGRQPRILRVVRARSRRCARRRRSPERRMPSRPCSSSRRSSSPRSFRCTAG